MASTDLQQLALEERALASTDQSFDSAMSAPLDSGAKAQAA